jgi:exodeoxyribonuclease VII large subunit
VGLITGESTAAYKDFTTRLDTSPFAFKIRTEYAKMQGNETESTILAALERLQQDPEIDVVCIVRGGGSKTDLNYFDSEALCRAVANYPVPVFTGIGHEIDKSLLDEVAYLSCITPTDCAKRLVERLTESWQAMLTMVSGIQDSAKTLLSETREELSGLAHSLQQAVFGRIQQEKSGLAIKGTSLAKEVQFILRNESQRVSRNEEGLKQGSRKILDLEKAKFEITELKVKSASPETALARGYSFTLDANGKFIRSKAQVKAGDLITTRLSDGTVQSVVQ